MEAWKKQLVVLRSHGYRCDDHIEDKHEELRREESKVPFGDFERPMQKRRLESLSSDAGNTYTSTSSSKFSISIERNHKSM